MGYGKFQGEKYPWLLPIIEEMKNLTVGDHLIAKLSDEVMRVKSKYQLHSYLYNAGATMDYHLKTIAGGIYIERRQTSPHVVIERSGQEDRYPKLEDPLVEKIFLGTLDLQTGAPDDKERTIAYLREQVEEHGLNSNQIEALTKRVEDFYKISLV